MSFYNKNYLDELEIARHNLYEAPALALEHAVKSLTILMDLCDETEAAIYEGETRHMIQRLHHHLGNYEKAYEQGVLALSVEERPNAVQSGILCYLAKTLHAVGLVDKGLEYSERAYKVSCFANDLFAQAQALMVFEHLYDHLGDHEAQLAASQKAVTLYQADENINHAAVAYNGMARACLRLKKMGDARSTILEAIAVCKADRSAEGTALYLTQAELEMEEDAWVEAEIVLKKAHGIAKNSRRSHLVQAALFGLAQLHRRQRHVKEAAVWGKRALAMAEDTGMLEEQAKCHQFLYESFKEKGAYKQALWHLEQSQQIAESVRKTRSNARAFILMSTYEAEGIPQEDQVFYGRNGCLGDMVQKQTEELQRTRDTTLQAIATLVETRGLKADSHIRRTVLYMEALRELLIKEKCFSDELQAEAYQMLPQCAALHDLGMVGIPDTLMTKPGLLSEKEFAVMKQHTLCGARFLRHVDETTGPQSFLELAAVIALSHHEKWDGTGYPQGLLGTDIPLAGRMMAIVDVYDALVSKRHYKPASSHSSSIAAIKREMGRHFDPVIAKIFVDHHERFREIALRYSDSDEERTLRSM